MRPIAAMIEIPTWSDDRESKIRDPSRAPLSSSRLIAFLLLGKIDGCIESSSWFQMRRASADGKSIYRSHMAFHLQGVRADDYLREWRVGARCRSIRIQRCAEILRRSQAGV